MNIYTTNFNKINNRVKLVVFDWAGTVIDYGCKAPVKAFKLAFNKFGLNPSEKIIRKYMGASKYDHINYIISDICKQRNTNYVHISADEVYNIYKDMQLTAITQHSKLITGVIRMQEQLNDRNILIATTTGYSREMLECVLNHAKLQCFDSSFINVSPDMLKYNPSRESGELMRYIFSKVEKIYGSISYNNVVKVGDTPIDMIEGINAGSWNIGCVSSGNLIGKDEMYVSNIIAGNKHKINRPYYNEYTTAISQLEKSGANYIVHDINSVVEVIDNYINPLIELGYTPKQFGKSVVLI